MHISFVICITLIFLFIAIVSSFTFAIMVSIVFFLLAMAIYFLSSDETSDGPHG